MHHLVGVSEIALLLGVSRQRADQIVAKANFPQPTAILASGRVWETTAVQQWIAGGRSTPQAITRSELAQLRIIGSKYAGGRFRSIYASTRQKGLGHNTEGIPATRSYAYLDALREARQVDPTLEVRMPIGWLESEDKLHPWELDQNCSPPEADVFRARVREEPKVYVGSQTTFTAVDHRQLIGTVIHFDDVKVRVRVHQVSL